MRPTRRRTADRRNQMKPRCVVQDRRFRGIELTQREAECSLVGFLDDAGDAERRFLPRRFAGRFDPLRGADAIIPGQDSRAGDRLDQLAPNFDAIDPAPHRWRQRLDRLEQLNCLVRVQAPSLAWARLRSLAPRPDPAPAVVPFPERLHHPGQAVCCAGGRRRFQNLPLANTDTAGRNSAGCREKPVPLAFSGQARSWPARVGRTRRLAPPSAHRPPMFSRVRHPGPTSRSRKRGSRSGFSIAPGLGK